METLLRVRGLRRDLREHCRHTAGHFASNGLLCSSLLKQAAMAAWVRLQIRLELFELLSNLRRTRFKPAVAHLYSIAHLCFSRGEEVGADPV